MAHDRRPAKDLSIQELEILLARKKREARRGRLDQLRRSGRVLQVEAGEDAEIQLGREDALGVSQKTELAEETNGKRKVWFNRVLLTVEVLAVVGFAYILLSGAGALRQLNAEVAEVLSVGQASPTPLITAVVLPSGHTPPTDPGGARPNEAEIPEHLRPIVQSMPGLSVPTPGPAQARSIFIPKLWNDAAPVVQGDGWEQLKKGVGQHIGSADPGSNGNMVLSAHNDIFGELFRDLDKLKPGDEIRVQTSMQEYVYRVTGMRIVSPTEVNVMSPTAKATVTLISCYPYLVDTERIVVFGELVDG
ncbi:MAG: class D sortase [Anaerolineales bacterium]|nr:class D sortase [Anaerolineales bacterium]